jgi:hypothetical protein
MFTKQATASAFYIDDLTTRGAISPHHERRNTMEHTTYELTPRYDSRKSFYGKAHITEYPNGRKVLTSYSTEVAEITEDGNPIVYGIYSQTTTRHQKEFLKQEGFFVDNIREYIA